MVVLGKTGRNFAAGMSGGIAYIYDPKNKFIYMHLTGQRGVFRTRPALRYAREIPVNLMRYVSVLSVGASAPLHITGEKL